MLIKPSQEMLFSADGMFNISLKFTHVNLTKRNNLYWVITLTGEEEKQDGGDVSRLNLKYHKRVCR